jgi:hypothetical protein
MAAHGVADFRLLRDHRLVEGREVLAARLPAERRIELHRLSHRHLDARQVRRGLLGEVRAIKLVDRPLDEPELVDVVLRHDLGVDRVLGQPVRHLGRFS